ncbi:MAG: four helix bundle protein [Phycisphaeraceae bacterium]|nr:four helix bundle protein [Phycisphaeraceae bacterium]
MELAAEIYRETSSMPGSERFGLTNQMRRAAVSVPSNIAEGFGRASRPEFLRFLRMARGSLFELQSHLHIATSLRMIDPHISVNELVAETDRVLQGLIRSIEERESEDQIA